MPADLHCHTRLSDGSLGIEDLIILAKNIGIGTIAITDHDSLAATVRGKIIGERHEVNVIPGVEISAFDYESKKKVHLLSYLNEYPDRLEGLCRKNSLERRKAGQMMVIKAAQRFPITPEFVLKCAAGSTNIYKQHIMHALMEGGFTTEIFGDLFYELFDEKNPENISVSPKYPDAFDVLRAIHEAGGIAVLAHPGFYDNFDVLPSLIEKGLDGVEVWHPENSEQQADELIRIADENGLLMTGGSDFHGMYGAHKGTLGAFTTPDDNLNELIGYKSKKKRLLKKSSQSIQSKKA
ncbi:MAG: PHP domain-containing protein [Oscillospiraceae bacterium]|nr:PHP domain-containing protein [Oscillospiraceae bacterium]